MFLGVYYNEQAIEDKLRELPIDAKKIVVVVVVVVAAVVVVVK